MANRCITACLPYDLPGAVQRFLEHFRPRLGILMETELWPNLIAQCARNGVPLLLANARLSEKSARGYRRWQRARAAGVRRARRGVRAKRGRRGAPARRSARATSK